jgi:glycosyltransferase involved in cell wall biosynthesis
MLDRAYKPLEDLSLFRNLSIKMRVLLLANVPTPYNLPLIEMVRSQSGWDFEVCFISSSNEAVGWADEDKPLPENDGMSIIDRRLPWLNRLLGSHSAAATALLATLKNNRPDYLILYGYTQLPQMLAIFWAVLTGTPFAVMGDANIYADCATGLRRIIKRFWLRKVTRRAAALIAVGTTNRLFWESYGALPEQLFDLRYPVDNDYFAREAVAQKAAADEWRDRMGLAGSVVFLYVGRLIERKRIDLLIQAVKSLPGKPLGLVIVGSGEEREKLEQLAAGDRRIVFAGITSYRELPHYYALADVLVLPARHEPWGLVINEAMASGLAVIAHRHCGAAVDLVGNDNGVALDGFSVDELAAAMRLLAGNDALRNSMQRNSREKIRAWSFETAAPVIIHAVEYSCQNMISK